MKIPDLFSEPETDESRETRETRDIFSVSRLNFEARNLLELSFPRIWIEGEVSNLVRPQSGHLYFSLKDEKSQVRCVMFRTQNLKLKFTPQDGQQVLMQATVGLYEARGDFQLNVLKLQEFGEGLLQRKFEELKQKLQKKGWFAAELKQDLPDLPNTIGLISSKSGAVIHDVLTTLRLRFPAIAVIIYPVAVQGREAAGEISQAIASANQRAECDALIVGRGGGSLEDLWPFNEYQVAKAIYQSKIPIVSAVGHESDITISDLAADKRAATPTAAAQFLSPDQGILMGGINKLKFNLLSQISKTIKLKSAELEILSGKLQSPKSYLHQLAQRLDELEHRLNTGMNLCLLQHKSTLNSLFLRLKINHPLIELKSTKQVLAGLSMRLNKAANKTLQNNRFKVEVLSKNLNVVSPLSVLARGFAIVKDAKGNIIKSSKMVNQGDAIDIKLKTGSLKARVEK